MSRGCLPGSEPLSSDGRELASSTEPEGPSGDDCTAAEPGSTARPSCAAESTSPATDPGFPEAARVHELLKSLQGIGKEVRLRFLDGLRMLYDGNLHYELGFSSFHQYCDRELGLARSTASEYLRVGRALDGLPRSRVLFREGELSWEQVRAISRVATAQTEVSWLELAFQETVAVLQAEVREAQRTGRDRPRERRYGLPNLMVRLCLQLTLEEKERVRAAFELVSAGLEIDLAGAPWEQTPRRSAAVEDPHLIDPANGSRPAQRNGDGQGAAHPGRIAGPDGNGRAGRTEVDPRPPLVRWADGILSGAIPAWPETVGGGQSPSGKRREPAQAIVYRTCPQCRDATLDTPEGAIAVPPGRIEELAPLVRRVFIDEENQAASAAADATSCQTRRGAGSAGQSPHTAAPAAGAGSADHGGHPAVARRGASSAGQSPHTAAPAAGAGSADPGDHPARARRGASSAGQSPHTAAPAAGAGSADHGGHPAVARRGRNGKECQPTACSGPSTDAPNSPRLTRQVLYRDGLVCANPGCGRRRNLHAHHIVFRSRNGPTVPWNEVAVCDVCHALIHQGLLDVIG